MAVVITGYSWTNEQITPANLNTMWTSATFNSGAVDDSTTALSGGAIIVKDAGITAAKLATDSVETAKILDANVTTAKLAGSLDLSAKTITLAAGQILTAAIADDGITYDKVLPCTQANMEGEAATGVATADFIKFHPGVAKAYGTVIQSADTHAGSYGVSSVSTATTGSSESTTVTLSSTMANTNYTVTATVQSTNEDEHEVVIHTKTTTTFIVEVKNGQLPFNFTVHGQLA